MVSIHIARPRTLAALVSLGLVTTMVAVATAQDPERDPEYFKVSDIPAPVLAPTDRSRAEEYLRTGSTQLGEISSGQAWRVAHAAPAMRQGEVIGATLKIAWDRPVTYSGPWTSLKCRGTWQFQHDVPWHDVRVVSVVVDLRKAEPTVLELIPSSAGPPGPQRIGDEAVADETFATTKATLTITDVRTGDTIATIGPGVAADAVPKCPDGLADD